jgi:hypothetical protein
VAELTHAQKETIIVLLAEFRSPSIVVAHMREEHGLELSIQQIVKYDPTRPSYDSGESWRAIFNVAREAYLRDISKVPIAHQAYRLNVLQEALGAAKKARNWKLAAELLEQAAKEVGGALTNSRDVNISDQRRARDMSSEERRQALGSILAEALASSPNPASKDDETKH